MGCGLGNTGIATGNGRVHTIPITDGGYVGRTSQNQHSGSGTGGR